MENYTWLEDLIKEQDRQAKVIEEAGGLIDSPMDFDEMFMRQVYLVAAKSKDPRTKIGAILVKDGDIISVGFNGFPRGVLDLKTRYEDRETKYSFVKHAESNSCLNAARKGISTSGGILYTQGVPCRECAKDIIQCEISEVVCHKQWPNLTHSEAWVKSIDLTKTLFSETGIPVRWFDKTLGIKGFLDGKEIEV
jgi:dCMP deaminase